MRLLSTPKIRSLRRSYNRPLFRGAALLYFSFRNVTAVTANSAPKSRARYKIVSRCPVILHSSSPTFFVPRTLRNHFWRANWLNSGGRFPPPTGSFPPVAWQPPDGCAQTSREHARSCFVGSGGKSKKKFAGAQQTSLVLVL